MPLGQCTLQWFAIEIFLRGRRHPEAALRGDRQMRVGAIADRGVRLLILPVQHLVEPCEDRLWIDEIRQPCALEELPLVGPPAVPTDQIIVKRPVLVGPLEIEIARLDRPGDMTEQKDLVERDPERPVFR
ncbi:MAG: hypothetical protein Q4P24_08790 [Rhodobacterales bacterium]|nr:hypothetical protein [Rhodobacterales bacterium]